MVNLIRQQHALQFLPKPEDNAGDFGKILGEALQGLAHHKIQQKQTSNKEKFLTEGGFHPEFARELAKQPDNTIQQVLSGLEGFGTQQQEQQGGMGLRPKGNLIADRNAIEQERNSLIKESHSYNKQVIDKGKEAQRKLGILNKIEKLNEQGKLTNGTWANINKKLGTSASFFGTTPETEQLEKLSAQLLPQGLSQEQLRSEERKVPNIGQSKQARKAIIKDLKGELQKEIDEESVVRDILKQNNGQLIPGLEQMVQDRLKGGQQPQQQQQSLQLAAQANTLEELNPQEGDIVESPDGSLFQLVNGQFVPYQGR